MPLISKNTEKIVNLCKNKALDPDPGVKFNADPETLLRYLAAV
jgi:hypothetical protein